MYHLIYNELHRYCFNVKEMKFVFGRMDVVLMVSVLLLAVFGVLSMLSLDSDMFARKQVMWIFVASIVFFISSAIDYKFLRRRFVVLSAYLFAVFLLLIMFAIGSVFQGAKSWIDLGAFAIQPSEFAKLALIIILAKYFSRRHVEIARFKHVVISGLYAFVLFALILSQPDLGSAMILVFIWFGMTLTSGLSRRHIFVLMIMGVIIVAGAWKFVLQDYQKQRIISFIHPLADIQGAGYNAYQSMIAVGSGGVWGKGVGYGTQSKLKFLPEHETDFIFASFAEEWGFAGSLIVFVLFGIVIWRVLLFATHGATNFEVLFTVGVAIWFLSQFFVNVGMNIGLLPVTGVTLPFMSYGGSHLVMEALALGIITSMRTYGRLVHPDKLDNEFVGI